MTMTVAQRHPLARHMAARRQTWDVPGCEAALIELGQQFPNDDSLVTTIAIAWTNHPQARTPAGMTDPKLRQHYLPHLTTTLRTASPTNEPSRLLWCSDHVTESRVRDDGELTCCWQERLEKAAGDAPPPREGRPVPAEAKAAIKAAIDAATAARTSNQREGDQP